jgi:1-acyl-sn-glycerol-3-phosphate acyltransferase
MSDRADGSRVPPLTAGQKFALTFRLARRGRGFWFSLAIDLIWPFLAAFTRLGWRGGEYLPAGGCLLAVNHLSFADPIVDTAFVLAHGRVPRYLAKAELWRAPVVRQVLAGGRHIPVSRGGAAAVDAYRDAVAAVGRGECVVFYPESTYTRDPAGWPMRGMNGLARVALKSGRPVVPVAQWGNQILLPPDSRRPQLLPRAPVRVLAGPPVDLSRFVGQPLTRRNLDEATEQIMAAITALLVELRGEQPPTASE